jgi:membrane-bound lytic murein transglycosylase C
MDMEAEFFQGQERMETSYREFENDAYEQFRREVEALWNEFTVSTKKDWVEYSGDKTARSLVDFESGEATVEVLVPRDQVLRDPEAVRKKLELELERLVMDRGKTRDYPSPVEASPLAFIKAPPLRVQEPPGEAALLELEREAALQKEKQPVEKPPGREETPDEYPLLQLQRDKDPLEEKQPAKKPPPGVVLEETLPVEALQEEEKTVPEVKKVVLPKPLLPVPVLENQLKTQDGEVVTQKNKKAFAKEVLETRPVEQKTVSTKKGEMVQARVSFPLVPDHLRIRAERHLRDVRKHAARFQVPVPLAFAVIHTESYFNPKAKSYVPAYGLMQLVPRSGGRDAYKYVYGKDKILGPEYLYQPGKNIELGCAYLGLLQNRYFGKVKDRKSAQFCAIASYNTGAGNLSRAITGRKKLGPAVEKINTMTPDQLYKHLRGNLPYRETRNYLKKVRERMDLYQEWK